MSDTWMRFGVSDGRVAWSTTWKLWTTGAGEAAQVNLASRFLGGRLTAKRASNGRWSVVFVRAKSLVNGDPGQGVMFSSDFSDGVFPQQTSENSVRVFRVLVPSDAVSLPHVSGRYRYVAWAPRSHPEKATELTVYVSEVHPGFTGVQAGRWYGRVLLGSFSAGAGQRVSVFYRMVDVECDLDDLGNGRLSTTSESSNPGRRLHMKREPDGAISVHDLPEHQAISHEQSM